MTIFEVNKLGFRILPSLGALVELLVFDLGAFVREVLHLAVEANVQLSQELQHVLHHVSCLRIQKPSNS